MRKELMVALLCPIIVLLSSLSFAAQQSDDEVKPRPREQFQLSEKDVEDRALKKFQGMNFGLGVGMVALPSNRLAKSARVVNGIVRVEDQANLTASVVLESHYFFHQKVNFLPFLPFVDVDKDQWGHGPFVAIRSGGTDNQLIDTIALGWMLGFRYEKNSFSSWNIGAGLAISPSTQVLGDGLTKNQPLPAGETDIRFQNKSLLGFMVLVSFSWNTFELDRFKGGQ